MDARKGKCANSHDTITMNHKTSSTTSDDDKDDISNTFYPSYRLFVALLGSVSMVSAFGTQTSMSSALVCMTSKENSSLSDNNTGYKVSWSKNRSDGLNSSDITGQNYSWPQVDTRQNWNFPWSSDQKAWALSIFFFAYYSSQLPSGIILIWFGVKNTLVGSIIGMAILQPLAVPASMMGLEWLYINRFLVGLSTGPVFAAVLALVAKWAPRSERSVMVAISGFGVGLGSTFSFGISSLACTSKFQGGWPLIFYIVGGWCLMVGILNFIFLTDWPSSNRFISSREKSYILTHTINAGRVCRNNRIKIPLRQILGSGPVWAIIITKISTEWIYYAILTQIPIFLDDILQLSDTTVSLASGIPFICNLFTGYAGGCMSDRLVLNSVCSLTTVRKINDGITKLIPGILIVVLGFLPVGSTTAVYLINIFIACGLSFYSVGFLSNLADVSPAHSGFITGLAQASSLWCSFAVPLAFYAATKEHTREQWQNAFYITAGIQLLGFLFYSIFASGELQPWAVNKSKEVIVSKTFLSQDEGDEISPS